MIRALRDSPPGRLLRRLWYGASSAYLSAKRMRPIAQRLRAAGLPAVAPGVLPRDDRGIRENFRYLADRAERLGPIFKTTIGGVLVTCVIGPGRIRRLLAEHPDKIAPVDTPYSSLAPGGFLRQLSGEPHRRIRRTIVNALRPDHVAQHEAELRAIARRALDDLAGRGTAADAAALIAALDRIAAASLFAVCFGLRQGDPEFAAIKAAYIDRFGPQHFVSNPGAPQRLASAAIAAHLRDLLARDPSGPPGMLHTILRSEGPAAFDERLVGNLVLMVEMGRYDLRCLMRWIVKHLGETPAVVAAIRAEAPAGAQPVSMATATVLEVLRLVQSEGINRRAREDIVFEGITIPRESFIRCSMRESNGDKAVFAEPRRFDPARFVARTYGPDELALFGYDHHACPAGDLSLRIGTIFVETLVNGYDLAVTGDGPYHHGPYHWEPAPQFAVALRPRS